MVEIKKVQVKFHRCSICGLCFSMGQALGGHMKQHKRVGTELTRDSRWRPEERTARERIGLNLDLNSIPMDDDGDLS